MNANSRWRTAWTGLRLFHQIRLPNVSIPISLGNTRVKINNQATACAIAIPLNASKQGVEMHLEVMYAIASRDGIHKPKNKWVDESIYILIIYLSAYGVREKILYEYNHMNK